MCLLTFLLASFLCTIKYNLNWIVIPHSPCLTSLSREAHRMYLGLNKLAQKSACILALAYPNKKKLGATSFKIEMACFYRFRQLYTNTFILQMVPYYLRSVLKRGRACRLSDFDSVVGPCLCGSMYYYLMCQIMKQLHVLHRTQTRIFHLDQMESELHHRNQ